MVLSLGNKRKIEFFLCIFSRLFVPLVLRVEGTGVRKYKRKTSFPFVFLSLIRTFDATHLRYSRSEIKEKSNFFFVFLSLIRTFAVYINKV